jgi:SnoaL-like domain
MNDSELKKFATRYAQAWCSHHPEAVVAFYAENALISVNDGTPMPIGEVARSFVRDFPDMVVTFDKLVERPNRVEFHWTLTGRYAANGNRVRISGYELWRIDNDGLIAESKGHFDAADYTRQLEGK